MTALVGGGAGLSALRERWRGVRPWPLVIVATAVALAGGLGQVLPALAGLVVLGGSVGAICVWLGLWYPVVAVQLLLVAEFARLPMSGVLPADPFLPAFVGVVVAATLASARKLARPRFGGVESAMLLYVLWNIGSAVAEHPYGPVIPQTGESYTVWRFVLTGTVIPFVLYIVGRQLAGDARTVRWLLTTLLVFTGYSAALSVLQINGPQALVFPKSLLVSDWPGRAGGIFLQPAENGLFLIVGFVVALFVAAQPAPWPRRAVAYALAAGAAYGVFLTHTRAVWLIFALILIFGALCARRFRLGFVATLGVTALAIASNWSAFTSSDRAEGGVASASEVEDRLNIAASALWAIEQKPWFGWGIARFVAVNTFHHQSWSWEIPWDRGLGIASHFNELGIAAELGVIGLVLWLSVLGLVIRRLLRAARLLRGPGLRGSGMVFLAGTALVTFVGVGFTVDLRFFDFSSVLVFTLCGVVAGLLDGVERAPAPPLPPAAGPRAPVVARGLMEVH